MKIEFPNNKKIGVGVSGGVDSMVLLDCLISQGADVLVVNIEHGIRGVESVRDSEFVKEYCQKNGIEFLPFSIDTLGEKQKKGISLELAARNLRYDIFYSLIKEKKADYIALAHHANDNAETVLMRILRGTGVRGIRGIVDTEAFIHPLLRYSRKEIENYARDRDIPFVEDSTNFESNYTRNYLRNVIFPKLNEKFSHIENSFSVLSENAIETEDFLQQNILPFEKREDDFFLNINSMRNAPMIIKKYSINRIFSEMGIFQDIEKRHYDYIIGLCEKGNNTSIDLPFSVEVCKEYDKLVFCKKEEIEKFCQVYEKEMQYTFMGNNYSFQNSDSIIKGCCIDENKIPKGSVIRTRKEGDIFKKCNGKTKKLSDFLNDKKIPKREREKFLYLAYGNEILAILGLEISDKIKIDISTKEITYIKKENI